MPVIQVIGLLVIATVGNRSPHWVAAIYLVLIAFAAVGAALFMDNLADQKTDGRSLIDVMKYRDSWIIAFLYIGTFGSFIGFSFAFGQVLQLNFLAGLAHSGVTPAQAAAQASLHAAQIAFIGPLLGSLARPFGGWLSDRTGGGKISLYAFIAMIFGAGILVAAGTISDRGAGAPSGSIMTAYVIGFIILFVVSGIGNGSVYKMIPSVFAAKARSAGLDETWSRTMSGALIGWRERSAPRWCRHQPGTSRLVSQRGQVGDHGVLGVSRLLCHLRGGHLVRVRAAAHDRIGSGDLQLQNEVAV